MVLLIAISGSHQTDWASLHQRRDVTLEKNIILATGESNVSLCASIYVYSPNHFTIVSEI